MYAKCLKLQLILFFILTAISFIYFLYQENLPDNMLLITSKTESYNVIQFYLSSLLALVGHFGGPWLFFPFMIFTFCYAFFYSQRNYGVDVLNIFFLLGSFLLWIFLINPFLLGKGTHYLINKYTSMPLLIIGIIVFPIAFFFGTFRGSFQNAIRSFIYFLIAFPGHVRKFFQTISSIKISMNSRELYQNLLSIFKVRLPSFLRGERNTDPLSDISSSFSKARSTAQEKENILASSPSDSFDEKYYAIMATLQNKRSHSKQNPPKEAYFDNIKMRIEDKLQEFGIEGPIDNVIKGPVVDTFELKLGAGIRVSKVRNISEDLSVALMGIPIRIVYPMLGKETVGIEVPRRPRENIYLAEILSSHNYKNSSYILPMAMGKNAFGEVFIKDLTSMPHMLVAGATGAGKSVFLNTVLLSLLSKRPPSQMKLLLIDPKQLEFVIYAKLPHLLMPVLTDAKRASFALEWACLEMERRYCLLSEFGVRNIEGLNKKKEKNQLPYLVIIIDEFADLILTKSGKEIENKVCRLAAKARACGIHLIVATQRPSVDVITGLIKANFPTRVSFRVTSPIDSRTILSTQGAEFLLEKGDMLYRQGIHTIRGHACYVGEQEIESLMKKLSVITPKEPFDSQAMAFLTKAEATSIQHTNVKN